MEAVESLRQVHGSSAQQRLGPNIGAAIAIPSPAQASTSFASSSSYSTAPQSAAEASVPAASDGGGGGADWVEDLRRYVSRQMPQRLLILAINLAIGTDSSTPSDFSHQLFSIESQRSVDVDSASPEGDGAERE